MPTRKRAPGHYLIACDFDQTLSFNDSGVVLSELIGASNFREKVSGLSDIHLVQQGAELTYLLRHDPEFRCVRRAHLIEAGQQVRLKQDIKRFVECLNTGVAGYQFSFYVISAVPSAVVQSALEGIVPADHIYGAECEYDPSSGEICAITSVPAGYGKVAIATWAEAMSLPQAPATFHREVLVLEDGIEYWLPIQDVVADAMIRELEPGQAIEIFAVYAGQSLHDHVFLVNEFMTAGKPPAEGRRRFRRISLGELGKKGCGLDSRRW